MIYRYRWARFLPLLLALFISSCFNNADRDNPLDPRSGKYQNFGGLEGHVYTYYAPFQPISSAMITLIPGNQITFTDNEGAFSFNNIKPDSYLVTVNYVNYGSDSARVQILSHKTISIQFNLDGLPQLDSLILITGFEYKNYPFDPSRLIECTTKVFDADGPADIASVAVIIPQINFKDTLDVTQTVGTYHKRIEESDLQINNIEGLLGLPFFIEIIDKVGKICLYGPKYFVRVIDNEPEINTPSKFDVVSSLPTLKWNQIQLSFLFSYKIEIYAFSGYDIIIPAIRTYSNISPDINEFQISKPLKSGLYLWTVYIVDTFGNWSRSKPATFQVGE